MPFFRVDGDTELFYTDAGDGPAVLLLHGWACDSTDWIYTIPALAARYRIVAVDNRGHGHSRGSQDLTPDRFAEDLIQLLDSLGIDELVVVGHSLGGLVASVLAVKYPERIRAIAVIDPAYMLASEDDDAAGQTVDLFEPPEPHEMVAGLVFTAAVDSTPAHLIEWHHRRALGTSPTVFRDTLMNIYAGADPAGRGEAALTLVRKRQCPVLAIYSTQRASAAEAERRLSTGEVSVHTMPGSHWFHQENFQGFNQLLTDWLSRQPAALG